jgi:hypothetical protein
LYRPRSVNAQAANVDVVDLADPGRPKKIYAVDVVGK